MFNQIFPRHLKTPHVDLDIPIQDGLRILELIGSEIIKENGGERSYTVKADGFEMALYEKNGVVASVWYNDPLGRSWAAGTTRKINLYLERYGALNNWEITMNNGWMRYYFNESARVIMVYGVDNDVIRINRWNPKK